MYNVNDDFGNICGLANNEVEIRPGPHGVLPRTYPYLLKIGSDSSLFSTQFYSRPYNMLNNRKRAIGFEIKSDEII